MWRWEKRKLILKRLDLVIQPKVLKILWLSTSSHRGHDFSLSRVSSLYCGTGHKGSKEDKTKCKPGGMLGPHTFLYFVRHFSGSFSLCLTCLVSDLHPLLFLSIRISAKPPWGFISENYLQNHRFQPHPMARPQPQGLLIKPSGLLSHGKGQRECFLGVVATPSPSRSTSRQNYNAHRAHLFLCISPCPVPVLTPFVSVQCHHAPASLLLTQPFSCPTVPSVPGFSNLLFHINECLVLPGFDSADNGWLIYNRIILMHICDNF